MSEASAIETRLRGLTSMQVIRELGRERMFALPDPGALTLRA